MDAEKQALEARIAELTAEVQELRNGLEHEKEEKAHLFEQFQKLLPPATAEEDEQIALGLARLDTNPSFLLFVNELAAGR